MKYDMVFWGVIVSLLGAMAVMLRLFFVIYRNATRDNQNQ